MPIHNEQFKTWKVVSGNTLKKEKNKGAAFIKQPQQFKQWYAEQHWRDWWQVCGGQTAENQNHTGRDWGVG